MKIKHSSNQGFTIVELLIVIVIIGILTAIGLVTYQGLTDNARKTQVDSAVGNLKSYLNVYYAQKGTYPSDSNNISDFKMATLPGGIKTTGADEDAGWATDNNTKVNLRYFNCSDTDGSGYVIEYKYPGGNWDRKTVGTTPDTCFNGATANTINLYPDN